MVAEADKTTPNETASARPGLLRKGAVDHAYRGDGGFGRVVAPIGNGARLALAVAIVFGGLFLLVVVTVHLPIVQRVSGVVGSSLGIVRITPQMNGSVSRILVKDGEQVKAGQALVVVVAQNSADYSSGLNALRRTLYQGMIKLAEERRVEEEAKLRAEQSFLVETRLPLMESQDALLADQEKLIAGRLERARQNLQRLEGLSKENLVTEERKVAALDDVSARQTELLQLEQQMVSLRIDLADTRRRASQVDAEIATALLGFDQQITELRMQLAQLEEDLSVTLNSPVDGVVSAVLATPGQNLFGSEELVTIIPDQSEMLLQFNVASDVVGLIDRGDEVRVGYPAFPPDRFGMFNATVEDFTLASVTPSPSGSPPQRDDRAGQGTDVFLVRARPEFDHVMVDGQARPIRPGMQVDGAIILSRKTILQWILSPLLEGVSVVRL